MILMTDLSESVEYITESSESKPKTHYITGVFMQSDIPNRNGRVYPKKYMESALNKFLPKVESRTATGQLGHPNSNAISLDLISHLIESLHWDGNNVIGKAKILDTPMGNIAKNLLEGGVKLGVSSRGLGSLKSMPSGLNEVQSDFILTTVDIVADPSAPDAFVNGILENVEYFVTDDGRIQEATKKKIKKNSLTEEQKVKLFQQFIYEITHYG